MRKAIKGENSEHKGEDTEGGTGIEQDKEH